MPDFLPAGGAPSSIACSVTGLSTSGPSFWKLNVSIQSGCTQPSIRRAGNEKCGSGSSESIGSQAPMLRPATSGE